MAPPAPTRHTPSTSTAVRITMFRSADPLQPRKPMAPE